MKTFYLKCYELMMVDRIFMAVIDAEDEDQAKEKLQNTYDSGNGIPGFQIISEYDKEPVLDSMNIIEVSEDEYEINPAKRLPQPEDYEKEYPELTNDLPFQD